MSTSASNAGPLQDSEEQAAFLRRLRSDGIIHDRKATLVPLCGGVSSDIYLVEEYGARFVVKRALAKLKVSEDWFADTSRNFRERDCLQYLQQVLPGSVPKIIASNDGYFVMEYLDEGFANWKQLLLAGRCDPIHAVHAGRTLGQIHRLSTGDPELASRFNSWEPFCQLRVDPYLLATGRRHPALREYFEREASRLGAPGQCLVHGDFSPKNLLIAGDRLVVLDCEVAWYGDPSFDLAFLLTHLLLKSLNDTSRRTDLQKLFSSAVNSYFAERRLDDRSQGTLDQNTAHLLLLLLLARVDGKSPVEYLVDESKKNFVRRFVTDELHKSPETTAQLAKQWFSELNGFCESGMGAS
jgi:aminoglycoside phosphotransferase (APT) family kinase protein